MAEKLKEIGASNKLWECACGKGHLSKPLIELGYDVFSTDLVDRGYGEIEDFLTSTRKWGGDIITNPPFKLAVEFVEKSMEILQNGQKAIFLLKIQFLETELRAKLFKRQGLKEVIVNSSRVCCAMNGEFDLYFKKREGKYIGGTQCYAWFVFEKGYTGKPVLDFV
ncbi:MAG: NAD(P)-dependent oxidoreductase [Clostridia bacterium]|nr:NAD(P)-dependent oxidoreductase [Clostridia bacterium]